MLEIPTPEIIKDQNTRLVLRAMKEQIEVLTGKVGDGTGRAMTQDDLRQIGVVAVDDERRLSNPALPGAPAFSTEPLAPGEGGTTPIGGVIAWLKDLTGVEELPEDWLECNGQLVADELSILDGTTLPDLNGDARFLKGAANSGTVGGEATHVLTVPEMPAHIHPLSLPADTTIGPTTTVLRLGLAAGPTFTGSTGISGGGGAHNNEPQFYTVVWIIRIR